MGRFFSENPQNLEKNVCMENGVVDEIQSCPQSAKLNEKLNEGTQTLLKKKLEEDFETETLLFGGRMNCEGQKSLRLYERKGNASLNPLPSAIDDLHELVESMVNFVLDEPFSGDKNGELTEVKDGGVNNLTLQASENNWTPWKSFTTQLIFPRTQDIPWSANILTEKPISSALNPNANTFEPETVTKLISSEPLGVVAKTPSESKKPKNDPGVRYFATGQVLNPAKYREKMAVMLLDDDADDDHFMDNKFDKFRRFSAVDLAAALARTTPGPKCFAGFNSLSKFRKNHGLNFKRFKMTRN